MRSPATSTRRAVSSRRISNGTVDLRFTQVDAGSLRSVGLLYQAVLIERDLDGFNDWAANGLDTAGLVAGFVGSGESAARYGALSDAEFVAALYADSDLDAAGAGGSGVGGAAGHRLAR